MNFPSTLHELTARCPQVKTVPRDTYRTGSHVYGNPITTEPCDAGTKIETKGKQKQRSRVLGRASEPGPSRHYLVQIAGIATLSQNVKRRHRYKSRSNPRPPAFSSQRASTRFSSPTTTGLLFVICKDGPPSTDLPATDHRVEDAPR